MAGEKGDKAERLLNLTLALLSAKRPLTKQNIFENVAGYSGKSESMERMFERDKDELRELGIEVSVLPIDAFFDDELGYRILPRDYFLPEVSLTHDESIWLALAANVIREFAGRERAQNAVHTLLSESTAAIDEVVTASTATPIDIPVNEVLDEIWRAIKQKISLQFTYQSSPSSTSNPEIAGEQNEREVSPYLLTSRFGNWYLVGRDLKDKKIKTFRIDRLSQLLRGNSTAFLDADPQEELTPVLQNFHGERIQEVLLKCDAKMSMDHRLIRRSAEVDEKGDLRILTIKDVDAVEITEMVLWAGPLVEVLAPDSLRERVHQALRKTLEMNS